MGMQSCGQEMCRFPVNFIASFLCAPPVATQFSFVRAPPVATLVSFFSSSHHFSGHRLWRLSFLVCHTVSSRFGHHQGQLFYVF